MLFKLVQCLTLLVLYPEHSTTRPSAFQPQPNGESPAKMRRLQSKLIPKLAVLALEIGLKLEEECVI
jgi:hypothetical protein